jgi:hypothetical protein
MSINSMGLFADSGAVHFVTHVNVIARIVVVIVVNKRTVAMTAIANAIV